MTILNGMPIPDSERCFHARADDTKSLKSMILDWITCRGQPLSPPLACNVKPDQKFHHKCTGALLCLAQSESEVCLSRFLFCCAEMALEKLWVVRWLYQAPNGHCFCIMGIAMTQRSLEWAIQKFPLDFCMCLQICYTFIYHTYTRECARHINTFSLHQALLRRSPRQLDKAMQEFMGCQKWCLHQSCMSQHR